MGSGWATGAVRAVTLGARTARPCHGWPGPEVRAGPPPARRDPRWRPPLWQRPLWQRPELRYWTAERRSPPSARRPRLRARPPPARCARNTKVLSFPRSCPHAGRGRARTYPYPRSPALTPAALPPVCRRSLGPSGSPPSPHRWQVRRQGGRVTAVLWDVPTWRFAHRAPIAKTSRKK